MSSSSLSSPPATPSKTPTKSTEKKRKASVSDIPQLDGTSDVAGTRRSGRKRKATKHFKDDTAAQGEAAGDEIAASTPTKKATAKEQARKEEKKDVKKEEKKLEEKKEVKKEEKKDVKKEAATAKETPATKETESITKPSVKATESTSSKKAEPKQDQSSKPAEKKKSSTSNTGPYDPNRLLKSSSSVLAKKYKMQLVHLLELPQAWDALTPAEQLKLNSMLPGNEDMKEWPEDLDVPNYLQADLKNNATFRNACADFQDDLADGHYTDKFIQDAAQAMKRRAHGAFDDWKELERESFYGQKQNIDPGSPKAVDARYRLADLIRADVFDLGDVWSFERKTRATGKSKARSMVKEATVTDVDPTDGTLDFSYPPAQYRRGSDKFKKGEALRTINDVNNPTPLLVAMMREDGRVDADERMSNAWKMVRVVRGGRMIGTLYDLREAHAKKMGGKK